MSDIRAIVRKITQDLSLLFEAQLINNLEVNGQMLHARRINAEQTTLILS